MGANSDISFTVAEILGDSPPPYTGMTEQQKYNQIPYNQTVPRSPYIPPRRTKNFWPKHIPKDGKH